ncbi:MAG: hypothetical protein R3B09_16830 [Nannocystaceae bacterium]
MLHPRIVATAALLPLLAALSGCAPAPILPDPNASHPLRASPEVYTLVNLHPDDDLELSSVNYQEGSLLPLCTPIRVTFLSTDYLQFTALTTGRSYKYEFYDDMKASPGDHVTRYFGTSCDPSVVGALDSIDQKGVREGKVYPGMSKDGVVLAIGYPPDHATKSLDDDSWRYWESRFDIFDVKFKDGRVVAIKD